jgi:hypothetical protein
MRQTNFTVEISIMENNMPEDIRDMVNASPASQPIEDDTTIRRGDIWRALWDGVALLILIERAETDLPNRIYGAPVDIGDEEADDTAMVLPSDTTTFSLPVTVWPSLATDFAAITLDRRVGGTREGVEVLGAVSNVGVWGRPILRDASPRSHGNRVRNLSVEILHDAAQLPAGSGTLHTLLADVPMATIIDALGGNRPQAVKIKRGTAAVDATQAAVLADLIGISTQAVLNANPHASVGFAEEVTDPRHRKLLRAVATGRKESESEAFAQMTQSVVALAARGERRDYADWAGRVDTYLAMALASS